MVSVVDFYATWCGPCKFVAPAFDSLSEKYNAANFLRVDVDQLQSVSQRCGVRAMPTFQLFKSGKIVAEVVGADINSVEAKVRQFVTGNGASGISASGSGYVLGTGKKVTGNSSNNATNGNSLHDLIPTDPAKQQLYILLGFLVLLVYWYLSQKQ